VRKLLLLSLLLCSACSKGPQADLPSIGEARTLGAEWVLINQQVAEQKLTRAYVETMRSSIREQLQTVAQALTLPNSAYGGEIQALLQEPDDASPQQLSRHVDVLKRIEDHLESA
jgi:hypothetical protein